MGFPGILAGIPLGFPGIPWDSLGFPGIPWDFWNPGSFRVESRPVRVESRPFRVESRPFRVESRPLGRDSTLKPSLPNA